MLLKIKDILNFLFLLFLFSHFVDNVYHVVYFKVPNFQKIYYLQHKIDNTLVYCIRFNILILNGVSFTNRHLNLPDEIYKTHRLSPIKLRKVAKALLLYLENVLVI